MWLPGAGPGHVRGRNASWAGRPRPAGDKLPGVTRRAASGVWGCRPTRGYPTTGYRQRHAEGARRGGVSRRAAECAAAGWARLGSTTYEGDGRCQSTLLLAVSTFAATAPVPPGAAWFGAGAGASCPSCTPRLLPPGSNRPRRVQRTPQFVGREGRRAVVAATASAAVLIACFNARSRFKRLRLLTQPTPALLANGQPSPRTML